MLSILTEQQLHALPTPRLLVLYRKWHRSLSGDDLTEENYVNLMKSILNTREHVRR